MPPYRRSYNKSKTVVNRVNASMKSLAFKAASAARSAEKAASRARSAALAAKWSKSMKTRGKIRFGSKSRVF